MPKRVMRGTGLQARLVEQLDGATEAAEILAAFRGFVGPDGERARFAAIAAAQDRAAIAPEVAKEIDLWLITHERLNAAREEVLGGNHAAMERLVMLAEELGKLKERMWWRFGEVDGLRKSAEDFGLGKLKQERSTPKATEAKKQKAMDLPPDWWDDALIRAGEVRKLHPSWTRSRVAEHIRPEFERSRKQIASVIKSLWPAF